MTWITRPRSEHGKGISWIRDGVGAPVVLIHGVGLRAEAWGAQMADFSQQFAVYAIDMPGHGESRSTVATMLADYTDTIATAVTTIDAPVFVAGHSMGALIALDLAIRYPQLCRGVVALNAIFRRSPEAAAAVRARAASLSDVSVTDPTSTLQRWFGENLEQEAAQACHHWLTTVDPAGYKTAYTVFAREDGPSQADLGALNCPVLFMTGSDEPNSTPPMSRAMAELTPQGEAEIIADAAHMMPMTHAHEVNAAMRRFFDFCRGV